MPFHDAGFASQSPSLPSFAPGKCPQTSATRYAPTAFDDPAISAVEANLSSKRGSDAMASSPKFGA